MNKNLRNILSFALCCATGLFLATGMSFAAAYPADAPSTLRVATWNIDSKAHPDIAKMAEIFKTTDIDIAGCQEIDVNNKRNPYDMMQGFVTPAYPYVHFAKGRDFADGFFGVGIVSRFEPLEKSSIPLESTGSKATKTVERVVFEKDGKKIALYNTHLSWESLDLRRRQIKEVVDRVKADPIPYKLITADFNADQHTYEYSMFLDNFNIANGHNGNWLRTYAKDDDPSMKFFAIDNIVATKNMRLTKIGQVQSEMADHYMLLSEWELLDHDEGTPASNNIALGQAVTVAGTVKDNSSYDSPYALVDRDNVSAWRLDDRPRQEITIELDRLYNVDRAEIHWGVGKVRAGNYTIAVSSDGKTYSAPKPLQGSGNAVDTLPVANAAKFLKFVLENPSPPGQPYAIAEIAVFGDEVAPHDSIKNLLKNGGMEIVKGKIPRDWRLEVTPETTADIRYILTADTDRPYVGKQAAKLTVTSNGKAAKGDGALVQTIRIEPNRHYQLSFRHRSEDLPSSAFAYEIAQLDAAGQKIPTHYAKLTDNLNMSQDWKLFAYNFTTAPTAQTATVALHVLGGEGSLWLDSVAVKEIIPTQSIFVSAPKMALAVGETVQASARTIPQRTTDLILHWVSSDETVAAVDDNGKITARAPGKAYIGLRSESDLVAESLMLFTVK